MAELLYSVERVFKDYLNNGQVYNIPEYQRGYKWTEQQVEQLLMDILDFETDGNDDLFYCLQNITIVEKGENLNVVDGQQRLTTLTLLLSYFNETSLVKNKINYAVREPSNIFLQKVISNDHDFIPSILKSPSFEDFINDEDFDYQDVFFMYTALRCMNNWFILKENEPKSLDKESYKEKLLKNVKLIVNRITGIEEQELFMNLNASRVHLDGSDLIRAILITRVAKQEMEEFDSSEIKTVVRLNERRVRIGWELDEINSWWSKHEVAHYFSAFTTIDTGEKET
ncbi:MAG: DUF262 domain-containing protein, partial [Bacteroidota bacterium]|nr:DUF262 domain-containing protein [Bacteroidota bacterium]